MIARFLHDRNGATAIEYAMIASLIAILLISALTGIGVKLEDIFVAAEAGFQGVTP
ncbi:MAG: Flp family type IVb pilin [Hyphomonadaceae bacterium]|nr:Flp family type IVb pilin [Hyphomonadaceae bacterium]